jgi:dCMP deaminase
MTNKWDLRFLDLAKLVASWSKDPSTQVGAVLTQNRRVISVGFNGFPAGMPDHTADYNRRDEKLSRIIHAEINAVLFSAGQSLHGASVYTYPFMSCDRCAVQLLQVGVTNFISPKATPDQWERWGASWHRTKVYARECGAAVLEVDYAGE